MSKVIPISGDVYPLQELINDLISLQDNIKDLVMVVIQKDEVAYLSHTGLSLRDIALAAKLMDKEFSNLVDLNEEERV